MAFVTCGGAHAQINSTGVRERSGRGWGSSIIDNNDWANAAPHIGTRGCQDMHFETK